LQIFLHLPPPVDYQLVISFRKKARKLKSTNTDGRTAKESVLKNCLHFIKKCSTLSKKDETFIKKCSTLSKKDETFIKKCSTFSMGVFNVYQKRRNVYQKMLNVEQKRQKLYHGSAQALSKNAHALSYLT